MTRRTAGEIRQRSDVSGSPERNPSGTEPVRPGLLEARGLRKSFGKRRVVDDVSFSVGAGEIVGLLGPNGAGKSTSFNMVVGLLPLDAGTVILDGRDLGRASLHQRARAGLGYLAQESTIFRGLTVEQNFLAVFEVQGHDRAAQRRGAEELLRAYDLEAVRNSRGAQLSGGERRRVEMARALIPEPKVVLLDEPFAGIDPIAVGEIKGFVRQMRSRGIGVLLTDHNVRETLGICDRAYLISSGSILLTGAPQTIVADERARRAYLGEDFRL